MSWELARVDRVCHRCWRSIPAGATVRRGDIATGLVWCEACAGVEFQESPPADLPAEAMPHRLPPTQMAFRRPEASAALQAVLPRIHDGRMAATGERE